MKKGKKVLFALTAAALLIAVVLPPVVSHSKQERAEDPKTLKFQCVCTPPEDGVCEIEAVAVWCKAPVNRLEDMMAVSFSDCRRVGEAQPYLRYRTPGGEEALLPAEQLEIVDGDGFFAVRFLLPKEGMEISVGVRFTVRPEPDMRLLTARVRYCHNRNRLGVPVRVGAVGGGPAFNAGLFKDAYIGKREMLYFA